MTEETRLIARNDVILSTALKQGNIAGMNELEIFEKLVHLLLNMKDEAMQQKLDELMNSTSPMMIIK